MHGMDNGVLPHKARPPSRLATSPCNSQKSFASTVNSAISITGKFSDVEHKYQIDPRVLGTGYQGSVRRCFDRATGEQYAIKSVRKVGPAVEPGVLAREIGVLRGMEHRNIVRLVDVCEDAEYLHIVTDLCEGGELFDKLAERRSRGGDGRAPCFAEDEAARILRQLLLAVSHMHERGVVHRDIKPENIVFEAASSNSPIKIIDFGLARTHRRGDPPMTSIVGTPYYIAPEVLRRRYDKSCDLWSVGLVAYTMLCGCSASVESGQLCFPHREWSGVSAQAVDFVHWLLKVDPRERMTAHEALNHPWITRYVDVHGIVNSRRTEDIVVGSSSRWEARSVGQVLPNKSGMRMSATQASYLPFAERHIRSYAVAKNEVHELNSPLEVAIKKSSKRGSRLFRRIVQKLK